MHMINTLHIHLNELDSHIFNFESSMTIAKYHDTSHMSKLERDIAVLQDHLEIHKKEAITWASKLQDDGQAYSFHDPTTQCIREILKRISRAYI